MVFINFSNHPSDKWDEKQRTEAEKFGPIIDIPFPYVSAEGDEDYIRQLAEESVERILEAEKPLEAVLVQGEFNLTYAVVKRLLDMHIRVLSACAERNVLFTIMDNGETVKESRFVFTRFREYRN